MKHPRELLVCTRGLSAREVRVSTHIQQLGCLLQEIEVFLVDTAKSNCLLKCFPCFGVMLFHLLVEKLRVSVPE